MTIYVITDKTNYDYIVDSFEQEDEAIEYVKCLDCLEDDEDWNQDESQYSLQKLVYLMKK